VLNESDHLNTMLMLDGFKRTLIECCIPSYNKKLEMHDLRARPSARAAWISSRDKSLQLSGVEMWMNLRGVWSTAGSPGSQSPSR